MWIIRRTRSSRQCSDLRGVLDCKAADVDDLTDDPRFGKVGKQTIKDTGPLSTKRMETIDEEVTAHAIDFMERAKKPTSPSSSGGTPLACTSSRT